MEKHLLLIAKNEKGFQNLVKITRLQQLAKELDMALYEELKARGEVLRIRYEMFMEEGNVVGADTVHRQRVELSNQLTSVYNRIHAVEPTEELEEIFDTHSKFVRV